MSNSLQNYDSPMKNAGDLIEKADKNKKGAIALITALTLVVVHQAIKFIGKD